MKTNTSLIPGFESKADIACVDGGHKKARHKTGLKIFGSGGRISPSALRAPVALAALRAACGAAAASEPASSQAQNSLNTK